MPASALGEQVKRVVMMTALMLAMAMPAHASSAPADFVFKCRNGKKSKVWLNPFKVVNNCGTHSEQWVTVYVDNYGISTDAYNVQPGATYKDNASGFDISKTDATLGRGHFCDSATVIGRSETANRTVTSYEAKDPDGNEEWDAYWEITTVYRPGSKWRAACKA